VLDEDPLGQLEELVLHLDERILARLTIAMTQSSSVILRVKHGKSGIPTLMVNGRGYAPFMKLPQLFVPTGMALRPNIRRDALRHLLARDGRKITWLRPLDEGQFTIESIAENAFHPLIEAYEYHVEELAQSFTAWKPSDAFPLEPFVQRIEDVAATIREDRAQHNANIAPTEERRRGMLNRLRDMFGNLWPSAPAPQPPPPKTRREKAPLNVDETLKAVLRRPDDKKVVFEDRPGEHQQRRQALEAKILANIAQSESVKRVEDWQELAALYRRANNHADAALCWLNVMWDQPELSTHAAWGWLHSESRGIRGTELNVNRREGNEEIPFSRWLEQIPTPSHARSLAAYVVWASLQNPFPPTFIANLNPLQSYLTEHENWLPIRALWLMRSALANLMKDDVLALARTRDRVVERMQESGLSLDLDVPSFLRFSTHGVSERFQKVRDWLKRLREPIRRWLSEQASGRSLLNRTPLAQDLPASRSASRMSEFGLDPELQFTPAYVDLILAWGLSRLSEHNASRDLIQQSSRLLSQGDPVHEILLDAYRYRIQQVQEGRASRGPLPTELLKRIGGLKPAVGSRHEPRYVVDKLRQHSRILEPSERMDAFRNPLRYQGASAEVRLALAGMPDIADNGELTERARQLFTHATRTGDSPSLPAVLLGILDVASRLGENILIPALREVGVAIELLTAMPPRVRLLDQAIFVAVQLGHASIVKDLLGRFRTILESQRGLFALRAIEPLTGESFRGLRRLGLRDECEQLLQRMEAWVLGGHDLKSLREKQPKEWPIALRTLLHIAAGWLFCGQDDRAKATLDEARDQLLYGGELPASEQTALALTYTATLSHADSRIALGRLEELFQRLRHVQLNSSTNSHYMLKPLELVETVVRSVVNDSFTLGPAVRRWLDDDEFLIRQHLDRDLRAVMEKQGLE